jgi:hypothetical protein
MVEDEAMNEQAPTAEDDATLTPPPGLGDLTRDELLSLIWREAETNAACAGCGVERPTEDQGWRVTDAAWCPKCAWLA